MQLDGWQTVTEFQRFSGEIAIQSDAVMDAIMANDLRALAIARLERASWTWNLRNLYADGTQGWQDNNRLMWFDIRAAQQLIENLKQ